MASMHELGARAEALAGEYLTGRGWTIIARNWRFRHKEIDLVAQRDRTVAFVEVRARSGVVFGHPLDTITWRKRRELATAARAWVARYGRREDSYRFDVIWLVRGEERLVLRHVPDAWRL